MRIQLCLAHFMIHELQVRPSGGFCRDLLVHGERCNDIDVLVDANDIKSYRAAVPLLVEKLTLFAATLHLAPPSNLQLFSSVGKLKLEAASLLYTDAELAEKDRVFDIDFVWSQFSVDGKKQEACDFAMNGVSVCADGYTLRYPMDDAKLLGTDDIEVVLSMLRNKETYALRFDYTRLSKFHDKGYKYVLTPLWLTGKLEGFEQRDTDLLKRQLQKLIDKFETHCIAAPSQ
jgi:hypothetical protein